ncbi:MAG: hypothetical protein NHB32_31850 [Fischerella sp. CENA71]|nr:hypothetical protein [Fischerella sp. CENA71]
MTAHESTEKRRCDDYKQIIGYIPAELAQEFKSLCASEGVSQGDALSEMIREWLDKKTASNSSKSEQANRMTTIVDVIGANMTKLRRSGVENLQALAKGEVLPSPGEFAIIMSSLSIPEEEQKMIWQKTFI